MAIDIYFSRFSARRRYYKATAPNTVPSSDVEHNAGFNQPSQSLNLFVIKCDTTAGPICYAMNFEACPTKAVDS
jgi:hypothetical protein